MVLYKECCLSNLFRNISNYLHHSFRNIDEKAQNTLSEFLQTTKNEIDYSGYFAYYKHCFKNNISINLLKKRKCSRPTNKFRIRHLGLSGLIGNQLIYKHHSPSLRDDLPADAVTEGAKAHYS